MPIKRDHLLQKLETVAPALADHDLVAIFQHILFTGQQVVAYNDRIAIATPLKTEFKGTIPGKTLIDSLRIVSHADSIELKRNGGNVQISAEKTKLTLQSHEPDKYVFQMPAKPKDAVEVGEKFFTAIDNCLQSAADHSTIPDHLGITFIPFGSGVKQSKIFATNAATISHSKVDIAPNKRLILPIMFCKEMLKLANESEKKGKLLLRDDHALFIANDVLLFSKLLQSSQPLDFEAAVRRNLPNGTKPVRLTEALRPRLKSALALSSRICDIKGNEVKTRIKCQNNTMEFTSASDRGGAIDRVAIKHGNVEVLLQASYLDKVYDRYDDLLITDKCAMLSRGDSMFMLACYNR